MVHAERVTGPCFCQLRRFLSDMRSYGNSIWQSSVIRHVDYCKAPPRFVLIYHAPFRPHLSMRRRWTRFYNLWPTVTSCSWSEAELGTSRQRSFGAIGSIAWSGIHQIFEIRHSGTITIARNSTSYLIRMGSRQCLVYKLIICPGDNLRIFSHGCMTYIINSFQNSQFRNWIRVFDTFFLNFWISGGGSTF